VTDLDQIRLLTGDTVSGDELLADAEIQDLIDARQIQTTAGTVTNIPAAAADAAGAIAAKFARDYDFSTDGQTFNRAQRIGHYMTLERELRNRSGGFAVPYTGDADT
jgi:predicted deacylase